MARPRSSATVSFLGVVLFWAGVVGAAELVSGYSAAADYISSLASRGSPVALLGVGALLASAAAHLATACAISAVDRSKVCASLVLSSAVAIAVVAVFRISCPEGPAGCGMTGAAGDWVDAVHGAGVVAYEILAVAAMVTIAVDALRGTGLWPGWLGAASALVALASVLLLLRTAGENPGVWQRLWVFHHHAWLLTVVWTATRRSAAAGRGEGSCHPAFTRGRRRHRGDLRKPAHRTSPGTAP